MEDTTGEFSLFHIYNLLVKEGKAKPLECSFCGYDYVIGHNNGELRLLCYTCDLTITPGIDYINNVRAVVKEHIL